MEDILGRPITWRVANDYAALKGAALGLPAILAQPRTPLATSIRTIARRIGGLEVERPRAARWPAWLPQVAMTGLRVTGA